ncbi:hypothetical protein L915_16516 [Phytophthora nicotianae]|uniref:Uncharacterized protein n=1 Tax=Phytophthora nicotianae TaxID=4792 RepID=W2G2I1_PHYNI|nr:hypothetical protein L915_16516 [Phytophthora nicotianae]
MSPSDYEEEEMWMRVELEDIESEQDAGAMIYEGDEALAKGTGYQAHTKHITLLLHLTEDAYWDIANFVVQATDQLLELVEIVCDFEAALMNAL